MASSTWMQGATDGDASKVIPTCMQQATDVDGRNSTALRGCVQLHVFHTGSLEAQGIRGKWKLFEFSGSQLLTDFYYKEKTCLLTPHSKRAAWDCTLTWPGWCSMPSSSGHRSSTRLLVRCLLDLIISGLWLTSVMESVRGCLFTFPSTKSSCDNQWHFSTH